MKVRWILLLAGMITIAATAGVPVPKRELRRILVVPVNLTDTALVQRIVSFAQANCPAEIAVTDPLPFSGSEAREALASVLKRLRRDGMRDAVTVLLGWPCDTAWHGFYDPEVEAGVVNLPALSAG
ncbi:MAG TPA: hypothetical protein EYP62_00605, partial [Kiritimatiellae bacterium]|nr:hypothetical protein [Kiritimatiellia bacterium]